MAGSSIVQATFDFGTVNTVHFILEGGVKTDGKPFLKPLGLDLYPLSDQAQERPRALKRKLDESKAVFDRVTDVDVEQQVPVTTPEHVLKKMPAPKADAIRTSQRANVVAYGISNACTGLLIGMFPNARVKTTSPKSKFHVLGLHRSNIKSKRKTMSNRFVYEFLMRRRHHPDWKAVVEKWASSPKRDDMSDCISAALAAIVRRLAATIDLRKVKKKVTGGKRKADNEGEHIKKRKTSRDKSESKN